MVGMRSSELFRTVFPVGFSLPLLVVWSLPHPDEIHRRAHAPLLLSRTVHELLAPFAVDARAGRGATRWTSRHRPPDACRIARSGNGREGDRRRREQRAGAGIPLQSIRHPRAFSGHARLCRLSNTIRAPHDAIIHRRAEAEFGVCACCCRCCCPSRKPFLIPTRSPLLSNLHSVGQHRGQTSGLNIRVSRRLKYASDHCDPCRLSERPVVPHQSLCALDCTVVPSHRRIGVDPTLSARTAAAAAAGWAKVPLARAASSCTPTQCGRMGDCCTAATRVSPCSWLVDSAAARVAPLFQRVVTQRSVLRSSQQ